MKPKKWNTGFIAICGGFLGAAITVGRAVIEGYTFGSEAAYVSYVAKIVGGAAGGAILGAAVSGLRNLFTR